MKTVGEIMASDVVWVSPSARVKTAVILMKGHSIGALPVVHANDEVAGIVTYQDVLGQAPDTPIADVMATDCVSITADMTIIDAAELMSKSQVNYLLIIEENQLKGIVSHSDLLPELGKTFDPLTGLPWSDQFREWAIAALKRGQEISVIFFDLDKYGQFNKKHGHVVGDSVLKEVAAVFKQNTDAEKDFACRYGGDEFAVVSIRDADAAIELAETIKLGISRIHLAEVANGVSGSYGIFGGRRTNERREIHYAATIDDLVTHASKNCTLAKPERAEEAKARAAAAAEPIDIEREAIAARQPIEAVSGTRLKIQSINFTSGETEATVGVTLGQDGREFSREASGYLVEGSNTLRLVAEATAGAASKALAPGHGVVVDEVLLQGGSRGEQIVTVVAAFVTPRYSTRCAGSAIIKRGDQFRAAAAAVLDAINRQIEIAPRGNGEQETA